MMAKSKQKLTEELRVFNCLNAGRLISFDHNVKDLCM